MQKVKSESKSAIEDERQKRLTLVKKVHTKNQENTTGIEAKIKDMRDDLSKMLKVLKADAEVQSEEISGLREHVDVLYVS